ncbi:MAG: TonB-dependent receptor family protein, partial [Gemmatimonadota bacterium]
MRSLIFCALLLETASYLQAQEPIGAPADSTTAAGDVSFSANAPAVQVVVDRFRLVGNAASMEAIPGSAQVIGPAELAARPLLFDDVLRILTRAPGLNLQEEDGYGLRPNIGMRGTGSERSEKITLLEDGILISPAPYAAPAAYYFPVVGRMQAIEVRKGSSQIKYGPRTTGGALNLVSSAIPGTFTWGVDLAGGGDRTGKARVRVGDSYARGGWMAETYQLRTDGFKQLDGGGDTGFDVKDYLVKLRVNAKPAGSVYQALELKLGRYDQTSQETYLGLTEADFRLNADRRYAGSQADVMRADQRQIQLRHTLQVGARLDLTTAIYRHDVERNWYKLASVRGVGIEAIVNDPETHVAELAIVRGGDSGPDALSVVAGQRAYDARGVQSILGLRLGGPGLAHDVELGIRFHQDAEDRFQHADGYAMEAGRMRLTTSGAPGANANRVSEASAWAFFIQDQIQFGRWTMSPGLRHERIDFTRTDYAAADPTREAPTRVRDNGVEVWIPGLGLGVTVNESASLFTGVHRGFAPPGPGADRDTEAEASINVEAGGRFQRGAWRVQTAVFHN